VKETTELVGQLVAVVSQESTVRTLVVEMTEIDGDTEPEGPVTAAAGTVNDDVPVGQTHPLDKVAILVSGGERQVAPSRNGMEEDLGVESVVTASTRIGMTAPVPKLKAMCFKTRSKLAPSPEWVVMEMKVLLSEEKTSSSTVLDLISWPSGVSKATPSQSSSNSVNPGSMGQPG
jgi:hypothetical protein